MNFFKRLAVNVLHDEEEHVFDFIDFVNSADIRMIYGGRSAGFAHKARAGFFVAHQFGSKCFDGDSAMELGVFGLVDHTHPTFAYFFHDAVMKYGSSDHEFEPERDRPEIDYTLVKCLVKTTLALPKST